MIKYRTLSIENYKSIDNATIDFTPGVFSVVGRSTGEYSSNGAGKSTLLQAMTIVLYNKDFQGAPLDTVSNRYTGKPFKISLLMDITKNGVEAQYLIVNDRATKKLTIKKNGKMHSSTTAKSLKLLQELLGMSEATFKFTHYITTNSILELTQNLSNATLFNEVLQVTELKTMGADLLEVKKKLLIEVDELRTSYQELTSIFKLLQVTDKYDVEDLTDQQQALESELADLEAMYKDNVQPLKVQIDTNQGEQRSIRMDIKQLRESIEAGICSLCGSQVATANILKELQNDVITQTTRLEVLEEEYSSLDGRLSILVLGYEQAYSALTTRLTKVEQDIIMGTQLRDIHAETLTNATKYSSEHYKEVQNSLRDNLATMQAIDNMRDAIRSGRIYEEVMDTFFMLVNTNIQKYKEVINFRAYDVEASSYKSGMVALLKYQGEEIPVESLSNGEKARLSLLLLSALLESMSQITNSESNFLALDEATSSFDKSGIEELSALFTHLKILEQSVFIITHGSELQNVPFDGELVAHKNDNISTAEFTKYA